MTLATDTWFLEVYTPDGLAKDDISVDADPAHDDVPPAFREDVDADYHGTILGKAAKIAYDGRTPIAAHDGTETPLELRDHDIYPVDGEAAFTEDDWTARPTLYAAEDGEREKVFWDGDTVVATPELTEDGLHLDAYTGSYAERLAAQDAVHEYDIDRLPLSTNLTVVPLLQHNGDPVAPIFLRSDDVAEYPQHFHTVAGGIPGTDTHPVDGGWREMIQEIRVGPDIPQEDYCDRGLVDEPERMRAGRVDGHPVYTVPDHGQRTIYRVDAEMQVLGIARNRETHTPELCAVVDTDLPYDIVEENYTRAEEHASIRPLVMDRESVTSFIDTYDTIIPVGEAALALAAEHHTGDDILTELAADKELPAPYTSFNTARP